MESSKWVKACGYEDDGERSPRNGVDVDDRVRIEQMIDI
jgi:hypothetical protein